MFLFFGLWVFIQVLVPLLVYDKLRKEGAAVWQATFLAVVSLWLVSWAILAYF